MSAQVPMGEEGKGVSVTVSHAQLLDDQAHVSLDSRMVVRLLLKGQGNGKQAKKGSLFRELCFRKPLYKMYLRPHSKMFVGYVLVYQGWILENKHDVKAHACVL